MAKPVAVSDLQVKNVDNEVLVHDKTSEKVHILNTTAGRILELCDGNRDLEDIIREFAAESHVQSAQVRDDVLAVVAEFDRLGLILAG